MIQPESGLVAKTAAYRVWAADNGCFSSGDSFDSDRWFQWVCRLPRPSVRWGCHGLDFESRRDVHGPPPIPNIGCLFVVAPDVVGDAAGTWERSVRWLERVRRAGLPVAVVAQDGAELEPRLWDECDSYDALFIGGTTGWKLGDDAYDCVKQAQALGKWVHIGRVNSLRRLRLAASWQVDSVDGTYLAYAPGANSRRLASWLGDLASQPSLFAR